MSRRAPARLLAGLLLAAMSGVSDANACDGRADGLHADYERACAGYVRCAGGVAVARHSCEPGRAFSGAAGACVPRELQPCVRRVCAPADTGAYAAPGTACREYYRCENGTVREGACPSPTRFDSERGACTRATGACYEPLCAGLTDGHHADVSHDCRRRLECRGGELRAVSPCPGGADRCPPEPPARCPTPRSAAVALPVGDVDFCADEACSTSCALAADGAHADRATACRGYRVCADRRVVGRGACEPGRLFSGASASCEPAAAVACAATHGLCFGRVDGAYRDRRDCRSWYACRRERVVARGSCDDGLVWDGAACVGRDRFACDGPIASFECATRPSGFYQDLDSDCVRYFRCDGPERTDFACPEGLVYDGATCVNAASYLCPSRDRDSCYGKPDGRYRARGSGCRGYYACAAGQQSMYACPPGRAFDERERACVDAAASACREDDDCAGLANGYRRDESSRCRSYFYCDRSERIATLTCFGSKLFDGERCVPADEYECGAAAAARQPGPGPACERNGFSTQPGTACRSYYFCVAGARTALRCPRAQVFDGQVCVAEDSYTCPGG